MAKESLATPKKIEDIDLLEGITQLVEQKKAEFSSIQGKIVQYKTQIISLEERLVREEADFNAKIKQEKAQAEKEHQIKLTNLINRESVVERAEADLRRRLETIGNRELQAEKIIEEKNKLIDERLKYEGLNKKLSDSLAISEKLKSEAQDKINEASIKEVSTKKDLAEIINRQSIIERDKEALLAKEADINKLKENLETLRSEVTPKIDEYKSIVAKNEAILSEIKVREQEIDAKIKQDNDLLVTLDDKERKLKSKQIELNTQEKELLRKTLLADKK